MNKTKNQPALFNESAEQELISRYHESSKRLFLFDYDGTLTPLMPTPDQAAPSETLLFLLAELASDKRNIVYIISGREYMTLGEWLGHLEVNLIAEHGSWVRVRGADWKTTLTHKHDWKDEVKNVMSAYSSRCENSFVEEKSYSLAWHYRNSPEERISLFYDPLIKDLEKLSRRFPISIIKGNKVVEVKSKEVNKGIAVSNILAAGEFDFIFACGDDTTDEDMFDRLSGIESAVTLKVGPGESEASLCVEGPERVLSVLKKFKKVDKKCNL